MENSRAVKELLSRHSQLEQSETKAQLSLITILSLTQITELKLLLDIGYYGNRFYSMILAMIIVSICLEVFVGIIVIYIGNLHYYQPTDGNAGVLKRMFQCLFRRGTSSPPISTSTTSTTITINKAYQQYGARQSGGEGHRQRTPIMRPSDRPAVAPYGGRDRSPDPCTVEASGEQPTDLRGMTLQEPSSAYECLVHFDRADYIVREARMRSADACVAISAAAGYANALDEATKRCPGSVELREELVRAQRTLSNALQERVKAEADERVFEAQLNRALCLKDIYEDEQERKTFRELSFWQHLATYLLYFILLLNIFIATFGISSGSLVTSTEEEADGGPGSDTPASVFPPTTKDNLTAIV